MKSFFCFFVSLLCLSLGFNDIRFRLAMVSETTEKYFKSIETGQLERSGLGAGSTTTLDGLIRADNFWNNLKSGGWKREPKKYIFEGRHFANPEQVVEYDVCVCGGTLGIFYAVALLQAGFKVCVLERGIVAGRIQEWNISEKELVELVRLGLLSAAELGAVRSIKFNPCRVGFKRDTSPGAPENGFDLFVEDVLNLGVRPDAIIALMRDRFLALGGALCEQAALERVDLHPDRVVITALRSASNSSSVQLSARLLLDAMGNASPLSQQARGPVRPDGICIVVGSCARGFNSTNNTYSDVIYADTPITSRAASSANNIVEQAAAGSSPQNQYFWEAFPAGSGPADRTTYLFTYLDAEPARLAISDMFDDYWKLLPRYQGVDLGQLQFLRFLYGVFPTYRASPLQSPFARVLAVGDASGVQSPLSFGGFGSLTRHLGRITGAVGEALRADLLAAADLACINAYQPNLSAAWMFQRAMSVPLGRAPPPALIVDLLGNSFASMQRLGPAVLRPFLQDVIQLGPLLRTLLLAWARDPLTPIKIGPHVGGAALLDFAVHLTLLALYTAMAQWVAPLLEKAEPLLPSARARFRARRLREAWLYGSGLDYHD